MTVEAFAFCPIVAVIVLLLSMRRTAREHRHLVAFAFGLHVVAAFAIVAYHEHLYGGGDMFLFAAHGRDLARLMRWDPNRYIPEVLKLAVQRESDVSVVVTLPGTPTGTMAAFTGLLMFVVGDSIYGASLLVACLSFYGLIRLYNSIEWNLEAAERRPVLIGMLFVPSAVFWCSGVIKEAFVVGFVGILAGAISDALRLRRTTALPVGILAAFLVAFVKPYVLLPTVFGVAGWFYAGRGKDVRLLYKVLAIVIAIAGVLAITRLFPQFGLDNLGSEMSRQQRNYLTVVGGASNVEIGDDDITDQSLVGHLRYAPLALINALLRPLPFDIHNFATLFASVEMMFLLWVAFDVLRRNRVVRVIAVITSKRHYMAALWFVLPFALSVGLATRNLGSLSRYRVPAMPLLMMTLLGVRSVLQARAPETTKLVARLPHAGPATRRGSGRLAGARARALPRIRPTTTRTGR